jgi:hypothetical protein
MVRHNSVEKKLKLIPRPRLKAEKGVPYSSEHLRRLEAQGLFPKRVRMNPSDPRGFCGYIESRSHNEKREHKTEA